VERLPSSIEASYLQVFTMTKESPSDDRER